MRAVFAVQRAGCFAVSPVRPGSVLSLWSRSGEPGAGEPLSELPHVTGASRGAECSAQFALFSALQPNKYLETKITSAIISEEEIADSASPELFEIRRKIRVQESKVRDQLDKMTHSAHYSKFMQENIITQRNGRYVVPVKAEYRGEVQGLVHDMLPSPEVCNWAAAHEAEASRSVFLRPEYFLSYDHPVLP